LNYETKFERGRAELSKIIATQKPLGGKVVSTRCLFGWDGDTGFDSTHLVGAPTKEERGVFGGRRRGRDRKKAKLKRENLGST